MRSRWVFLILLMTLAFIRPAEAVRVTHAEIWSSSNDATYWYINQSHVATTSWYGTAMTITAVVVSPKIFKSSTILAFRLEDLFRKGVDENDGHAGSFVFVIDLDDGTRRVLASEDKDQYRIFKLDATDQFPNEDWTKPDFDDSAWSTATYQVEENWLWMRWVKNPETGMASAPISGNPGGKSNSSNKGGNDYFRRLIVLWPSETFTPSATPTPSASPTPEKTRTFTATPVNTLTQTFRPTGTPVPPTMTRTFTRVPILSSTPTAIPTSTPVSTATSTAVPTLRDTATPLPTRTETLIPRAQPSPSMTWTPAPAPRIPSGPAVTVKKTYAVSRGTDGRELWIYVVHWTNRADLEQALIIQINLPEDMEFVSGPSESKYAAAGHTLSFRVPGPVAKGATGEFKYVVRKK